MPTDEFTRQTDDQDQLPIWQRWASFLSIRVLLPAALLICCIYRSQRPKPRNYFDKNDDENNKKVAKQPRQRYIGLPNQGNTCYFNSLLQALVGSEAYCKFTQTIFKNNLINKDENDNHSLLWHFIFQLLFLQENDTGSDPSELHQLICTNSKTFRMNEECDSHELNLFIQDMLCEVIAQKMRNQESITSIVELSDNKFDAQNPLSTRYETSIECQECMRHGCPPIYGEEYHLDINIDIVKTRMGANQKPRLLDLAVLQFVSEEIEGYKCIKCSLRQYLQRFLPAYLRAKTQCLLQDRSINWVIHSHNVTVKEQNDMRASLDKMLQMYQDPDLDEDKFVEDFTTFKNQTDNHISHELSQCKVTILRSKKMIKPPKILCFHLNRLCYNQNGDLYMNRTQVDFGETLRPIHPSLNPHGHDLEYKLCSVIEHYGSVMGGHYVAARRIHNPIDQEDEGKFLFCNDSFVNIIPVEKVLEANPFMIFYERVF